MKNAAAAAAEKHRKQAELEKIFVFSQFPLHFWKYVYIIPALATLCKWGFIFIAVHKKSPLDKRCIIEIGDEKNAKHVNTRVNGKGI